MTNSTIPPGRYDWTLAVQLPDGRPAGLEGTVTIGSPTAVADMKAWAKEQLRDAILAETGQRIRTTGMLVIRFEAKPNESADGGAS